MIEISSSNSTAVAVGGRPRLDCSYFQSVCAILKYVELVLFVIVITCISIERYGRIKVCYGGIGFMDFVCSSAALVSLVWLILYICIIPGYCQFLPNVLVEMIVYAVCTLCYLIGSCVTAACASEVHKYLASQEQVNAFYGSLVYIPDTSSGGFIAGTVFGFIATVVYGADCFFIYRIWKAGGYIPSHVEPKYVVQVVEYQNA